MQYISFDETKPYDIVLLGRVALDFNPVDYNRPLDESTTFKRYLGGSPCNIAVGMSRLGKKCGFIGKVSDDQFGRLCINYFDNEGIDISNLTKCVNGENIGLTFTEILSPTESHILMYRNEAADLKLSVEDVCEEYICKAKMLFISGTALAASPSREAALKALSLAKKNGIPVVFDIDYRAYTWKNEDEISIYYSIVASKADIILGSREEYDLTERLSGPGRSDQETADACFADGAKIVVIKHGKDGSTAYTCDGSNYTVKPFPVAALKGFGGGDGYASAFLCGLLDGKEVIDCLEMGSAEAAMLIASHSCSADMPSLEALYEFIKAEKEKYGEMVVR